MSFIDRGGDTEEGLCIHIIIFLHHISKIKYFRMTSAESICYTLINGSSNDDVASETQIKADIEQTDVKIKGRFYRSLSSKTYQ